MHSSLNRKIGKLSCLKEPYIDNIIHQGINEKSQKA